MVLGIAGSRSLNQPLPDELMPPYIDKIISGGARGIDRCARNYALERHICIIEILPEYELYGRRAPLLRNDWIISAFRVINRLPKEKHRRSKPYENTEIRD